MVKLQQCYPGQSTLVASPDQATERHMQETSPGGLMGNKAWTGTQTLLCCSSVSLFERNGREMPARMNASVFPTHQMLALEQSGQILLILVGFGSGPQLVLTEHSKGVARCTALFLCCRNELSAPELQHVFTHRLVSSSRNRFGTKALSSFISITRNVPASTYCCEDKHCSLSLVLSRALTGMMKDWAYSYRSSANPLQTAEIQLVYNLPSEWFTAAKFSSRNQYRKKEKTQIINLFAERICILDVLRKKPSMKEPF